MGNQGGPRMGIDGVSRRRVLKASGVAGVTAVTGLSGCLGTGLLGGGASYRNWLYAPGEIGRDHYSFTYIRPPEWLDAEDELDGDLFDNVEAIEDSYGEMDVDFDDMDTFLQFHGASIITGSFDESEVVDELGDENFDDEDEHEGYTIYAHEEGEAPAVGVDGGTLVWSGYGSDGENAMDTVELVIDAKNDEEDRYVDENEDFEALVDALGNGAIVSGRTYEEIEETVAERGRFKDARASGYSVQFDGETSNIRAATVFEDSGDIDADDIEDWVDDSETFADLDDESIETDGRTAVVTGTFDTDDVHSGFF